MNVPKEMTPRAFQDWWHKHRERLLGDPMLVIPGDIVAIQFRPFGDRAEIAIVEDPDFPQVPAWVEESKPAILTRIRRTTP